MGGPLNMAAGGAHVLMTADAVGSVWTYALDLGSGLVAAGLDVTLAVLGPPPDDVQRQEALAIDGLKVIVTGLPLDRDLASDAEAILFMGSEIATLAASLSVDLVHLNSPMLAVSGNFPVPVVGGCHSCLATWWRAVRGLAPLPASVAYRADLLSEGYRRCRALIAPTRSFAVATARRYGLGREPHVVHIGRSCRPLAAAPEAERAVFTAGQLWDEGRNLAVLDRTARLVEAPIRAAGPVTSPQGKAIRLDRIELLGPIGAGEIARRLRGRPVFVSTALYDPFGLAVLQAAQAGCALVLSDIPSFRELWDGVACFVPPKDERQIAATIRTLLDDPAVRANAGAAAAERARAYSVERMVRRTMAVYGEVLSLPLTDAQAVA